MCCILTNTDIEQTDWHVGVRHEGEPEGSGFSCDHCSIHCNQFPFVSIRLGKYEQIGGFKCYVATPPGDYPKDKVILFLTDVFGLPLVNNLVSLSFLMV